MRNLIVSVPALLFAAAASAQSPQAASPHGAPPHAANPHGARPNGAPPQALPAPPIAIPPQLSDPAMADQLGRVAGVVARSMMDLPVGELEAAIEGRPVTPADRGRRVRDNMPDPYMDQRIAAEAAASGRTMQATARALAGALPGIMQSLEGARREIERATANLPSPLYPRR